MVVRVQRNVHIRIKSVIRFIVIVSSWSNIFYVSIGAVFLSNICQMIFGMVNKFKNIMFPYACIHDRPWYIWKMVILFYITHNAEKLKKKKTVSVVWYLLTVRVSLLCHLCLVRDSTNSNGIGNFHKLFVHSNFFYFVMTTTTTIVVCPLCRTICI